MTRSIDLYQLQETDTAIDAAQRRLEEIAAELAADDNAAEVEVRIGDLEEELLQARANQRTADDAVTDQRVAVSVLEEKLYGGSVKIPKELKALQDDVLAHQRQLTALEERSLAALSQLERGEAALQAEQAEHAARSEERRNRLASLEAETGGLSARLDGLHLERERRAARVDPPDLALYERLRRARGGRAVAKVERGTCQGCRIGLPTTVFQRARSGLKIVQCTSCERILYVV